MLLIATSALGSMVSGTFSLLESLASASGQIVSTGASAAGKSISSMSGMSKDDLTDKAKHILPDSLSPLVDQINYEADQLTDSVNDSVASAVPTPQQTQAQIDDAHKKAAEYKKNVTPALHNFFESIGTDNYDQAKNNLVSALAQASGKSPQEMQEKVNAWQKSYEDAKAKAAQVAKDAAASTADFISKMSLIAFILIATSVIAAGIGGMVGANYCSKKVIVR
jgi:hypothetical protein